MFAIEYHTLDQVNPNSRLPNVNFIKQHLGNDIQLLGDGFYSRVYHTPGSNSVVKVTHGQDRGYWAYLMTIRELGDNNPYLPRIEHVTAYLNKQGALEFLFVRMERLEPIGPIKSTRAQWRAYMGLRAAIFRAWEEGVYPRSASAKDLIALLLTAFETGDRLAFDIHADNIMRRGRQLVVIDPFACRR